MAYFSINTSSRPGSDGSQNKAGCVIADHWGYKIQSKIYQPKYYCL